MLTRKAIIQVYRTIITIMICIDVLKTLIIDMTQVGDIESTGVNKAQSRYPDCAATITSKFYCLGKPSTCQKDQQFAVDTKAANIIHPPNARIAQVDFRQSLYSTYDVNTSDYVREYAFCEADQDVHNNINMRLSFSDLDVVFALGKAKSLKLPSIGKTSLPCNLLALRRNHMCDPVGERMGYAYDFIISIDEHTNNQLLVPMTGYGFTPSLDMKSNTISVTTMIGTAVGINAPTAAKSNVLSVMTKTGIQQRRRYNIADVKPKQYTGTDRKQNGKLAYTIVPNVTVKGVVYNHEGGIFLWPYQVDTYAVVHSISRTQARYDKIVLKTWVSDLDLFWYVLLKLVIGFCIAYRVLTFVAVTFNAYTYGVDITAVITKDYYVLGLHTLDVLVSISSLELSVVWFHLSQKHILESLKYIISTSRVVWIAMLISEAIANVIRNYIRVRKVTWCFYLQAIVLVQIYAFKNEYDINVVLRHAGVKRSIVGVMVPTSANSYNYHHKYMSCVNMSFTYGEIMIFLDNYAPSIGLASLYWTLLSTTILQIISYLRLIKSPPIKRSETIAKLSTWYRQLDTTGVRMAQASFGTVNGTGHLAGLLSRGFFIYNIGFKDLYNLTVGDGKKASVKKFNMFSLALSLKPIRTYVVSRNSIIKTNSIMQSKKRHEKRSSNTPFMFMGKPVTREFTSLDIGGNRNRNQIVYHK